MPLIGIFGKGFADSITQKVIGSEECVNGGFDADTDWDKGVNWTIEGGVLKANDVDGGTYTFQSTLTIGKLYLVVFTVSNFVSGNIRIYVGSSTSGSKAAAGTYTAELRCIGTNELWLKCQTGPGNYEVDNVSVKEITNIEEDE